MTVHHTAVVLESDHADAVDDLRQFALQVSRAAGAPNPLLVRTGGRTLWVWLGTASPLTMEPLHQLAEEARRRDIVLGVGSSTPGLAGFVLSHEEALEALRIGRASPGTGPIVCYPEVEIDALLRCTPAVDRFVMRTLGPLTNDDITTRRIRETVDEYLAAGGNVDEASHRLFVHRNTVRYRLTQAEEMLGHRIPKLAAALSVAVRHFEIHHREGDEHHPDPA